MDTETRQHIAVLLRTQRWAALATTGGDGPLASMVAYAVEADFSALYLHLSGLAAHTRNLLADPRVSLAVSEPDDGRDDPQTLARLTIEGDIAPLGRDSPAWRAARDVYLARLPAAEPLFDFGDFTLFCLTPARTRYVGGFARAHTLSADGLRACADA